MTILVKTRSKQNFASRIAGKAKGTQHLYEIALKNFATFCDQEHHSTDEEIINEMSLLFSKNPEAIFDTLQEWLNWNTKKGNSPNTLRVWFSCLKKYLHYRGIKLDKDDIDENIEFPSRIFEELYPLQIGDIHAILAEASYEKKAKILAQISSGMRIGELVQIRKKNLDLTKERIMIKIPASIAKYNKARTTFLSIEATKMIRQKLKRLDEEDLVWGKNSNPRHAEIAEMKTLSNICKRIGLCEKYESTGRNKISTHSFRAYFITKLSRHDPNFAKKLAGQKGYMLQYDRMNDDEKLQKYIQLEPDLLIYDLTKKEERIQKLELEKDTKFLYLENKIHSIESLLLRINAERSISPPHPEKPIQ